MRSEELSLKSGGSSLRIKLALLAAGSALLISLIASLVVGAAARNELYADQSAVLDRNLRLLSAYLESNIDEISERAAIVAKEEEFATAADLAEATAALESFRRRNAEVIRASLVDASGKAIASTDASVLNRTLLTPTGKERVVAPGPGVEPEVAVQIESPVPGGRRSIISDLSAERIERALKTIELSSEGAVAYLAGVPGQIGSEEPIPGGIDPLAPNGRTQNWFAATLPIRWSDASFEPKWTLTVAMPASNIDSRAQQRQFRTLAVGMSLGLATALLLAMASTRITRRLDEIGRMAFDLRLNRYAPVRPPAGSDEVARLGRIISGLVSELNEEVSKKEAAENSLISANYELEQKVAERTKELEMRQRQELEIAGEMQSALLIVSPPSPNSTRLSVDFRAIAARQINGDFIAWFNYNRDQFDLVLGDAMGKGLTAAVAAAGLRLQFERAIRFLGQDANGPRLPMVAEIVAAVEKQISRDLIETGSFATLAYMRIDLRRMRAEVLNSGHPAILRLRGDEPIAHFEQRHMPIGFVEHQRYESLDFDIQPGDRLVVLSDGVLEAAAPDGEYFGWERLEAALRECQNLDPAAAIDYILERTRQFGAEGTLDDASIAMIEVPTSDGGIAEVWEQPFELDAAGAAPEEINKLPVVARVTLAPIVSRILSDDRIRPHEGRIRVQLGRIAGQLALRIAYFGDPIARLEDVDADYGTDALGRNLITVWIPG